MLPKPLVRELSADLETPTSRLSQAVAAPGRRSCSSRWRAASAWRAIHLLACSRARQYHLRPGLVERHGPDGVTELPLAPGRDVLHVLQAELAHYQSAHVEGLPRFIGGLVGFLGYETIRQFEPHLRDLPAAGDLPEGIFLLTDTLVAFDHARRSLFLIAMPLGTMRPPPTAGWTSWRRAWAPPCPPRAAPSANGRAAITSSMTQAEYEAAVRARQGIHRRR